MSINEQLMQQLGYLADDETAMVKMLNYAKKLVRARKRSDGEMISKKEILDGLATSLREVKLARDGKAKLLTIDETFEELGWK